MMRRAIVLGLVAGACARDGASTPARTSVAPAVPVAKPPAARADEGAASAQAARQAELAWAKSRWPEALADVLLEPPMAALLGWVNRGSETAVWLTLGDEYRCQRAALAREAKPRPVEESGEFGGEPARETLALAIILDEKLENGRRYRETTGATIDDELLLGHGVSYDVQEADGTWTMVSVSATSEIDRSGVLSRVTDDVAEFAAHFVTIEPECPAERLPCAGGGWRDCVTCKTLSLKVATEGGLIGLGRWQEPTCTDPCPPPADNPDAARIRRLFEGGRAIRIDRDAPPPTLHRSEARCAADLAKRATSRP